MTGVEDEFYIDDVHVFYIPDILSGYNSIYVFTESEKIYISGSLELANLTDIFEMFK